MTGPGLAVLCIGLDPFLLRMVRSAHPEADIRVAVDGNEVLQQLSRGPDVIVQAADDAGAQIPAEDLDDRVVTVVDRASAQPEVRGNGQVLVRPVDPRQLRLAMDRAAGTSGRASDRLRNSIPMMDRPSSTIRLFVSTRVVVTAFIVLQVLVLRPDAGGGTNIALVAGLIVLGAHAAVRSRQPAIDARWLAGDVGAAVLAGLLLGRAPSPVLLLLLLVAAESGFAQPPTNAAGIISSLAAVTLLSAVEGASPMVAVLSFLLVLVAGVLGHGLADLRSDRRLQARRALHDVHGALLDLHRHAQANPDRLHMTSLRQDLAASIREDLGADRVALSCGANESWWRPATSDIAHLPDMFNHELVEIVANLHGAGVVVAPTLTDLVGGGGMVMAAPVRLDGLLFGVVVAAWDAPLRAGTRRNHLAQLDAAAADAAIALDSATLFAAIDELSVSGERQRIARDLHDGIVQSFVHVGLELDRLADQITDIDVQRALAVLRLRDVVNDAVMDSRRVISRLRSRHLDHGLEAAIESHLDELRRPDGPTFTLRWNLPSELVSELASELFRVVQEGVANARAHAHATRIDVLVAQDDDAIVVRIDDDGIGIAAGIETSALRGHGLPAMRERLALLGGDVEIGPRAGGGTRLRVAVAGVFPTDPSPHPSNLERAVP